MTTIRLDTESPEFDSEFGVHRDGFLEVLSHSYTEYHGDAYHLKRIVDGRSILYFALVEGAVIAASYVKRNRRRGGTAVNPAVYRRLGLAEMLIRASFEDFPDQYSILEASNVPMTRLLRKLGFTQASSEEQIKEITKEEFSRLFRFSSSATGLLFARHSDSRQSDRQALILLHRSHADA